MAEGICSHLLRPLVGVDAEKYGACCVALCGGLMLWCRCVLSFKMGGRCVLSFKMGFWVCGSRGVRDVHVIRCTRVVQIGVAGLLPQPVVLPILPSYLALAIGHRAGVGSLAENVFTCSLPRRAGDTCSSSGKGQNSVFTV